jgi:hypothetical protein
MRKKFTGIAGGVFSGLISYAIPKALELYGMINQASVLLYTIVIAVIAFISIVIWGYWPEISRIRVKQGASKMILNIGLWLGAFSILGIIVASLLVIPKLIVPTNDTRTSIQIQLDALISDIREYETNLPPQPNITTYNPGDKEAEAEATKIWKEWADPIWTDYYNKFSGRIANTMNQLRDARVITEEQYMQDQHYWISMVAHTGVSMFLSDLEGFKVQLDKQVALIKGES